MTRKKSFFVHNEATQRSPPRGLGTARSFFPRAVLEVPSKPPSALIFPSPTGQYRPRSGPLTGLYWPNLPDGGSISSQIHFLRVIIGPSCFFHGSLSDFPLSYMYTKLISQSKQTTHSCLRSRQHEVLNHLQSSWIYLHSFI